MSMNKISKGSTTEDLHDARLPDALGTAGQAPVVNSAGTGFEYASVGGLPVKTGTSDPTSGTLEYTAGSVGQFYVNTSTGRVFTCKAALSGEYAYWQPNAFATLGAGAPPQYASLTGAISAGHLYYDTTNAVLYICAAASGITLTWVAIGTTIVANPTATGSETDLERLQIGNVHYNIPSGGGSTLYQHNIMLKTGLSSETCIVYLTIINTSPDTINQAALKSYLNYECIAYGGLVLNSVIYTIQKISSYNTTSTNQFRVIYRLASGSTIAENYSNLELNTSSDTVYQIS